MSAAAPQPPLRGAEKTGGGRPPEESRPEQLLFPSGQVVSESGSGEGQQQQEDDEEEEEDHHTWPQRGRPQPQAPLVEAPPPKENPWSRWKPPPASGSSLSPSSASTGSELALQDPELQSSAKVIKAGKPKTKKSAKANDFSDATNWPTPSEIANSE
ncbi:UNVERIFIED_CONTAM: hypothetical protein K2H54_040230, partial [Gekko kuhli]